MASILENNPDYASTSLLDNLRKTEYSYMDEQNHVYLDYTGAGVASHSQFKAHAARLSSTIYGNPHSINPSSRPATELVEMTRARILQHLSASADDYVVIFTQNASGGARLIAESYQFDHSSKLVLTSDNHNSVNGLREFARRAGTATTYVDTVAPDLRISTDAVMVALSDCGGSWFEHMACGLLGRNKKMKKKGLFAYPAQSNFSGVRHPLSWVPMAQARGYDVLLDAAAFLPTSTLDLSIIQPEFVLISWYKLFGYPTGVGCLIARRDALARLERPWFAGGTVLAATVGQGMEWHLKARDEAAFEDGTVNFLSIPDVYVGLDWLESIGMPLVGRRVQCLTGWFLDRLLALEHANGAPMVRLYGPRETKMRGGTVTFNFLDDTGAVVDERLVAVESAAAGISLRTGCFCNPGGGQAAFGLDKRNVDQLRRHKPANFEEAVELMGMPSKGAVRVSFGLVSTVRDIDRFFQWAETYRDRRACLKGLPPRGGC
jgi:selenocysteine lyase/cysteine desulfurase